MKFDGVDPAEVAEIEENARAMQAIFLAKGARWIGRKIRQALAAIGAPAVSALRCWSCRRRTLAELNGLSEAMLRDIGIEQSQIPMVAAAVAARSQAGWQNAVTGAAANSAANLNKSTPARAA